MVSYAIEEVCGNKGDVLWGRWQVHLAILLALPVLLTGMYGTNYVFLAAQVPYRCHIPECEDRPAEWSPRFTIYTQPPDHCTRYQPRLESCSSEAFENATIVTCEEFVYQNASSIVAEFDLACQEWKLSMVGTVHNIGMMISLPIVGHISDRWGRRTALIVSGCGAGILGLCKSFVSSYSSYVSFELMETVFGASVYPAAFVLLIEWLGVKQRLLASLVLGIPLSFGAASLSLLDYFTGNWRLWARIAYPPSFILLLYLWLLPESVRWLVTRGRHTEAVTLVKKAAKSNRVKIDEEALEKMLFKECVNLKGNIVIVEDEGLIKAFLKYSVLRSRLCVCFVWWISALFVFYGLAVRAHSLSGSPHINYALVASAELPALLLNTLLLDRIGRRPLLTFALLLTATALMTIPFLPESMSSLGIAFYLLGKVGATMTLNVLYVYTAELFPTRARHRLLAACSTFGRLGSIIAPFTSLLAFYTWPWLPTALFATLPLISALLTRFIPDTLNQRLPDTYADLQNSGSTPIDV